MVIKKLYVKGSNRLSLSKIKTITYIPKSSTQLILGTNGSGKSSIMEYLFPFVPNINEHFEDGGGIKLELVHSSFNYTLTSGLHMGKRYSFKCDGNELNDSGLGSIQKELIEKEFGITPFISKFILGQKGFSDFSKNERKDWLTLIDPVNYEPILNKYNTLYQSLKDEKSTLKTTSTRISVLKNGLSKEDRTNLIEEIESTEKNYNDSKLKLHKLESETISFDEENIISNLTANCDRLDELQITTNGLILNDIKISIMDLRRKVGRIDKKLNILNNDIKSSIEFERIKAIQKGELESKIVELDRVISKYTSNFKLDYLLVREAIVSNDLPNLYEDYQSLTKELEMYKYCKNIDQLREDYIKISDELSSTEVKFQILEHNKRCDKISCPKCDANFIPNYDEKQNQSLATKLSELKSTKQELNHSIVSHEKFLSLKVEVDEITSVVPSNILTQETMNEITGMLEHVKMIHEVDSLKHELEINQKNYLRMLELNLKDSNELIREQEELLKTKGSLSTSIESYSEKHKNMLNMKSIYNKILEHRSLLFDVSKNKVTGMAVLHIKEYISGIETTLSDLKNLLIEDDKIVMQHETYNSIINECKKNISVLTESVRLLSPSSGLIGDTLLAFQHSFFNEVNELISEMWSYSLEVLPCSIKNGKLDYNFPMMVDHNTNRKDISNGSRSMQDVINLAIITISMRYLGFDGFPLFVDEFGSAMDETHRSKSMNFIDKLKVHHSNVFIISHYVDFYGGMSNVDINVISDKNIDMGDSLYNINMNITR